MAPRKRRALDEQLSSKPAAPEPVAATPPPQKKTAEPASTRATARVGKKAISGFFDPIVAKQLKILAVNEERTTQAMIGEALNLLFEKYGKDAIAAEE